MRLLLQEVSRCSHLFARDLRWTPKPWAEIESKKKSNGWHMRFGWLLVWRCLKVSNHGFAEGRGHADCQFAAPWTTLHNFRFFAACAPRPGYSHHDFESISFFDVLANLHQRVVEFIALVVKSSVGTTSMYKLMRDVCTSNTTNNWRRLRRMLS